MNPVIGLDVSKGESMGQCFLDKGHPFGKVFTFDHTKDGLDVLFNIIRDLEKVSGQKPTVIFEATGHYHAPLVQILEEFQYSYIIINPLISKQARKTNLRKVKTDAVDAYLLGELYYKEEFEPYRNRGLHLLNLRFLTRLHESMSDMYVQTKLQFQSVLDQVFPEYLKVFGDPYSKVSLRLLLEFKHLKKY